MGGGKYNTSGGGGDFSKTTKSERPDIATPDDALASALKQIEGHQHGNEIVKALAGAVIAQELTRMTVTGTKMTAGDLSSVDPNTIISDWQVLSRHYASDKYQSVFDSGAEALRKLTQREAQHVIYEIRIAIESTVNQEMEKKVVRVALSVPIIGPILSANLSFAISGTQVAVRKLQGRMVRLFVQYSLWLSVVLGTIHWISWAIFNEPYFVLYFEEWAKLSQFLLLISTTFIVWALLTTRGKRLPREGSRWPLTILRIVGWLIVVSGWCYWFVWLIIGIPDEITGLAEPAKLVMPFILILGSVGAWMSGRIFSRDKISK